MRVMIDLEIDTGTWETDDARKMTDEEALELLAQNDQSLWSDMFFDAKIKRVPNTSVFKGEI